MEFGEHKLIVERVIIMNKKKHSIITIVLLALLLVSIGINLYFAFWGFDTYLQSTDESCNFAPLFHRSV